MNSISISFVISMLIAVSLTYPTDINDCFKPCPFIFQPVCGFNGEKYHTFVSECNMEVENCVLNLRHVHTYSETKMSNCEKNNCNKRCTKEYNPICAFNDGEYKVFGNECLFEYENCMSENQWSRAKAELCNTNEDFSDESSFTNECDKICTLDYTPVCGTDGEQKLTYGNMCSFEVANCYANNHLRLLRSGAC